MANLQMNLQNRLENFFNMYGLRNGGWTKIPQDRTSFTAMDGGSKRGPLNQEWGLAEDRGYFFQG